MSATSSSFTMRQGNVNSILHVTPSYLVREHLGTARNVNSPAHSGPAAHLHRAVELGRKRIPLEGGEFGSNPRKDD